MSDIHSTAIVDPGAEIASDATIGPYTIIESKVSIGAGSVVASHVRLASGTVLGKNVKVSHGAVIGTVPQDLKFEGEETKAIVGDGTVVREYATINRGTNYHQRTELGKNCFVMAYAHVAHDCLIGDNVILANSVNLAGHIEIDDYAILGGVLPVHQFVKIGAHAMIGGGFRVQQDVVPFALVAGYPLRVVGINSIGLRRRGFETETIQTLERAFKILFFSKLNTSQALERLTSEVETLPEVKLLVDFVENRSNRGIVK